MSTTLQSQPVVGSNPAMTTSSSPEVLSSIDSNTLQSLAAAAPTSPKLAAKVQPGYTPRRRNAIVPLPLLPPVPSHLVVKKVEVKVSQEDATAEDNLSLPSPGGSPPRKTRSELRPMVPLRNRLARATSPSSVSSSPSPSAIPVELPGLNPKGLPLKSIPRPSFPLPVTKTKKIKIPDLPIFKPIDWNRPRISNSIVPEEYSQYHPISFLIPAPQKGSNGSPASVSIFPYRHTLHPNFCFRPRPRAKTASLVGRSKSGVGSLKASNGNVELRKVVLHANPAGRKICWMGVRVAKDVWEAERDAIMRIGEEGESDEEEMEGDVDMVDLYDCYTGEVAEGQLDEDVEMV